MAGYGEGNGPSDTDASTKWTYCTGRKPGRPPIDPEVAALVVRCCSPSPVRCAKSDVAS